MARPPARCGTDGGYFRHIRTLKEPACRDCLAAHADAERTRMATARAKNAETFGCGHYKTDDNVYWKADRGAKYRCCLTCRKNQEAARRARRRAERGLQPAPPVERRFDTKPLAAYIRGRGIELSANLRKSLEHAVDYGHMSEEVADRIACAAGIHPGLLWPEWFEADDEMEAA